MADSTTKNDLLLRTAQGDRDAFSLLYDEVAPIVYGIALRVVRDPARAEEVSQEAFLQVWDHSDRFDPVRGTATAWIAAIAHRRAVDVVRSEQAARRRILEVGSRSVHPPFDEVIETVERSEEADRLRIALAGLTPLQREAVDLAYFGGKTYREVAVALNSPLGTIKTRMRSALAALGDILGPDNG